MNLVIKPTKNMNTSQAITINLLNLKTLTCKVKKPLRLDGVSPVGRFKLNVDGSSLGNPGMSGGGGVLRYYKGKVLFAFASYFGLSSNSEAELRALLEGLNICYTLGMYNVDVETDSLMIRNWWSKKSKVNTRFSNVWDDIQALMDLVGLSLQHIYREANQVADHFAKLGARGFDIHTMGNRLLPRQVKILCDLDGDTTTTSGSRELDQTPTWAVAGVCAAIIIILLALEFGLHKLGTRFTERHKKALFDALEKIKAELMVLGFISLILTFGQYYIAKICIPLNVAQTMLPCPVRHADHRRLLLYEYRVLSGDTGFPKYKHGKVPLISTNSLHQLHILVFFLAVFHVVYSAVTVALGRLKIRGWKQWDLETESPDYEFSNDPSRFRLTHETSFVRAHISFWTRNPISFYIGCFFRQFFSSVSRSDYLTLRNGFISVHMAPGSKFNFQNYIKRSLVDDFKTIVGSFLWATFVIFLLLNVSGWNTLFWASLVPLVIILSVGTKLQAILTSMALGITERHAVVQGIPLVQGSDKYFWFSRPRLVLHLLHFVLFQNAFQITYFLWLWYEFNLNSCFHDSVDLLIIRIAIGISVLLMCSYITLPLYALVAQMGSDMKKTIFDEQTSTALKKWHNAAKKKQGRGGKSPTRDRVGSPIGSASSTLHSLGATLHRFKSTGHSVHSTYEDQDISDIEADPLSLMSTTTELIVRDDNDDHSNEMITPHSGEEDREEKEFSFVKLASQK